MIIQKTIIPGMVIIDLDISSYNVITLWHVLEHIYDIPEFFEHINRDSSVFLLLFQYDFLLIVYLIFLL